MKKTALVLGGGGFIGGHLAKQLKVQDNQDDFSKNSLPKFKKDIEIKLIHQTFEHLSFSTKDFSFIEQPSFFIINNYTYNSINDCFHPPKLHLI